MALTCALSGNTYDAILDEVNCSEIVSDVALVGSPRNALQTFRD